MVIVPCDPNFHWTSGEMRRNFSVLAQINQAYVKDGQKVSVSLMNCGIQEKPSHVYAI